MIESPINYLIEREYLAQVEFEIIDIAEGEVGKSEYYSTMHESVFNQCESIVSKKENTIIFAQSKAHAIALSIYLQKRGLKNGLFVGETTDINRNQYLSAFGDSKNDLNILVNHQILSTGIDVPGMNSIMVLGEINSPTLALQILGRAMRGPKNGGNKSNTIYLTPRNKARLRNYQLLESIVLS